MTAPAARSVVTTEASSPPNNSGGSSEPERVARPSTRKQSLMPTATPNNDGRSVALSVAPLSDDHRCRLVSTKVTHQTWSRRALYLLHSLRGLARELSHKPSFFRLVVINTASRPCPGNVNADVRARWGQVSLRIWDYRLPVPRCSDRIVESPGSTQQREPGKTNQIGAQADGHDAKDSSAPSPAGGAAD